MFLKRILIILGVLVAIGVISTSNMAQAQSGVTVTTAYDGVRLRGGPGTQFPIITTVPFHTALAALARSSDSQWIGVNYNNQYGWMNIAQLSFSGSVASLPVRDANTLASGNGGQAPTPNPTPDGAIISLNLYASTAHVNYYHLLYYSDGLKINGFYAEPRFAGKYPAVIFNRGGVAGTGALTGMELAPFAESGFVVVASQYRGGPGSEGNDHLGGDDVHDVTNLIILLKNRPYVDPNRISMFGTSRGAMMTYLALKQQTIDKSHDIKIAMTTSGLADLIMWAAEQPQLTGGAYPQYVGVSLSQDRAPFIARSATYWARMINVPILIMHGSGDTTVSVAQSRRLYARLRAYGKTAKLIVYPGDQHGLPNNTAGLPDALKWLQRYIALPGENFDYNVHVNDIYAAYAVLKP